MELFNGSSTVQASWHYIHAALTDKLVMNSHSNLERSGYVLVNDDDEHGQLVKSKEQRDSMISAGLKRKHPQEIQFIEVPLLTIDMFVKEQGLKEVDIIKVDAEGSDVQVIEGAVETITSAGVKVITFECTDCLVRAKYESFFQKVDEAFGFDCYLHGINQIVVKMTGGCWDYGIDIVKPTDCIKLRKCPYYLRSKTASQWAVGAIDSNAYCIHRTRAPVLHGLVDELSLHHFADVEQKGHFLKDAFISAGDVDFTYSQNYSNWQFRRDQKNLVWYHRMYGRDIVSGDKLDLLNPAFG